jgi:hypothetical protein
MSYQFANLNGSPLLLLSGGAPVLHVPVGFNGAINLNGEVTVTTVGQMQVTTNAMSDGVNPFVTLNATTPGEPYFPGLSLPAPPGGIWPADATLHWHYNADGSPAPWANYVVLPSVPTGTNYLLSVHREEGFNGGLPYGVWTAQPATNTYTTNYVGGTNLGSYTGGEGVRLVVAGVANVEAQTYAGHFEALGWGLALGVVVFGYRFVVDVIGSIGREQDL